jgi:hypothetical protein
MGVVSVVWSFVKSRAGEWVIILLLVAGIGWHYYAKITTAAKAEGAQAQLKIDQPKIDAATTRATKAEAALAAYEDQVQKWRQDTASAEAQQKADNAKTLNDINQKLAAAQKRASALQTSLAQVKTHVTAKDDARCIVNVGFVRVFNGSLEASSPFYAGSSVAGGIAGDDEGPSGITLSDVASIVQFNNAEAVQRGVIIKQWQAWYTQNKASFEKAQQAAAEGIPKG